MEGNPSAESTGYRSARVWNVGDLGRGTRQSTKRAADSSRIRLYDTVSPGGNHIHPLRAWIILGIASPTGATAIAAIATRGHW